MNNGNGGNGNGRNHDNQIVLTSRIRETTSGRESLTFDINLALFTISVVAMIPYEDEQGGPVYLHFRVKGWTQPRSQLSTSERRRFRTRETQS